MPSKRRTKSREQPKSNPVKKTTRMKRTDSGKRRKSGQANTAAAEKQKPRPLTTADISDIVTAVVEVLPPREDTTTARTQSGHGTGQRTTERDRQPDQAIDKTTSRATGTRRESRSRRHQTPPVPEQDATNEENSEDDDFAES